MSPSPEGNIEKDGILLLRLNRKEIENYLVEAQVIEKALLNAAKKKKQYIENINCPSLEEIKQKINRITTQENIFNHVK